MNGTRGRSISRRLFLVHAGRGALGIAVVVLAACSAHDQGEEPTAPRASGLGLGLSWRRVDFGYTAAYVLARGDEAALVDTGDVDVELIGAALDAAGPGWHGLRHVLITHAHADHWVNVAAVAERAPTATVHIGARDLSGVNLLDMTPEPVDRTRRAELAARMRPVEDGADLFGLQVVGTPGHTPGHIAVFDSDSRVLAAGDALVSTSGGLRGPHPFATQDMKTAEESVRKLADLEPEVILVGHGSPVVRDAATQLRQLANSVN